MKTYVMKSLGLNAESCMRWQSSCDGETLVAEGSYDEARKSIEERIADDDSYVETGSDGVETWRGTGGDLKESTARMARHFKENY